VILFVGVLLHNLMAVGPRSATGTITRTGRTELHIGG